MPISRANEIKQIAVNQAVNGFQELIAAPTSPKFLAIDYIHLINNTAGTVVFMSGSTVLTGSYMLAANTQFILSNPDLFEKGVLQCQSGSPFYIRTQVMMGLGGFIKYRIFD